MEEWCLESTPWRPDTELTMLCAAACLELSLNLLDLGSRPIEDLRPSEHCFSDKTMTQIAASMYSTQHHRARTKNCHLGY